MVLTRSASKLSSDAHNMPTTSASETCGTNTTTTTSVAVAAGTTTGALTSAPIVLSATGGSRQSVSESDVSINSEAQNQTIPSPEFHSMTAQNIRQRMREGVSGQQNARNGLDDENIQGIIDASVELWQARCMRNVEDRIQKAMDEMKQLLIRHVAKSGDNIPPPAAQASSVTPVELHQPVEYVQQVEEVQHQPSYVPSNRVPVTTVQPSPLIPAPNLILGNQSSNNEVFSRPQQVGSAPQRPVVFPNQPPYQMTQNQSLLHQPVNLRPNSSTQGPVQYMPSHQGQIFQAAGYEYQRTANDSQHRYPQEGWSVTAQQAQIPQAQSVPNCQLAMSMPYRSETLDKFKLDKWGVKFDGTNKTINVQEFIFRVSALQRDYNVADGEMLRSFHLLLEGPALDWYWDYRKIVHISTWQELERALLSQYRRFEQEHQVQMKILNRRQLPQEPFEEFYNAVIKLRNQQTCPYREEQLVEIMRGNLKPSLAQMLFSVKLSSLSEFCREVRRAESLLYNQRQLYQQRANMPHRISELDYAQEDYSPIGLEVDGIRATGHYTCWNCRKVGHSFVDCPEPITRQFCFRCGKEGVVAPKCPNCQGNRARYPPRTGEARSTNV